jgi:hypothetical protein
MNSNSMGRQLLWIVIAFALPIEARAQSMSVPQGNPVRVWSEDHPRIRFTGTLQGWTADSLTLQPKASNAQQIHIALASISRLEVRKSVTKSQALTYGALAGAASAAVQLALAHGLAEGMGGDGGWSHPATPYLIIAGGATWGGLSGMVFRNSLGSWRRVSPDSVLFVPHQQR